MTDCDHYPDRKRHDMWTTWQCSACLGWFIFVDEGTYWSEKLIPGILVVEWP